jgi:acetyl esterase/lipase
MGAKAVGADDSRPAIAMRAARTSREILLTSLLIALALSACSEHEELRQNNDPDRYTLVEDVLWASPDGFDITMDIYTPKSGKGSYPVVVMFHGGG